MSQKSFPSLAALLPSMHIFLCASRHLSFTHAAKELCVTQSAVSHRIQQLEEALGFPLFHRFTRKIALTEEGERLFAVLRGPLHDLELEIRQLQLRDLSGSLVLTCPPSFAGMWLIPRLRTFQHQHPGVVLHVRCRNDLVDFENESVDMAVYYGSGQHPGLCVKPFMQESLLPVCAPQYALEYGLCAKNFDALRQCIFLHDAQAWPHAQYYSEWLAWAAEKGIHKLPLHHGYSFDRAELALLAAEKGLGIAMGRRHLIQNALASGALLAPFDDEAASAQSYYVVMRKQDSQKPKIVALLQWLMEEKHK